MCIKFIPIPLLSMRTLDNETEGYGSYPYGVHALRRDVPTLTLHHDAHFIPRWMAKSFSTVRIKARVASLSTGTSHVDEGKWKIR